jgi:hypothetical protein
MCPNCLTNIAMAIGGAGSAVVLMAAGLRYRTVRASQTPQSNTEEPGS